jgi:hypothetical protein
MNSDIKEIAAMLEFQTSGSSSKTSGSSCEETQEIAITEETEKIIIKAEG